MAIKDRESWSGPTYILPHRRGVRQVSAAIFALVVVTPEQAVEIHNNRGHRDRGCLVRCDSSVPYNRLPKAVIKETIQLSMRIQPLSEWKTTFLDLGLSESHQLTCTKAERCTS